MKSIRNLKFLGKKKRAAVVWDVGWYLYDPANGHTLAMTGVLGATSSEHITPTTTNFLGQNTTIFFEKMGNRIET